MASAACVNNLAFSPENFLGMGRLSKSNPNSDHNVPLDPNPDFEFRLQAPLAAMLPADQLFSDGKLLPLIHLSHSPNSPSPPRSSHSHNTPFKHLLRLKHFLHRPSISKSPPPPSNDSHSQSQSRRSVSSSAAVYPQYRPRLSLDSRRSVPVGRNPIGNRGISVESPRLSSSGKIVFERLERSSSTPGGGFNQRGIERSNSATANLTVRVTPVLNLPVSSLRTSSSKSAFAQFFSSSSSSSQSKKETTNCCNKPYRHVTHARNRSYPI